MKPRPISVLLVEDNDVYRSSLELLLGMYEDVVVVGAIAEGSGAVAAVSEFDPDIVLMDFRLPGLDGAAATRAVREAAPGVAVVCLTAEATAEERESVLASGAVALLEKGEPVRRLLEVMKAAVGGRP